MRGEGCYPGRDGDSCAVLPRGSGHASGNFLGGGGASNRAPRGQQEREFVPADPERLPFQRDARGNANECGVAGLVAMAVVDLLEIVKVEQAEREQVIPFVGALHALKQTLPEMARVSEPGEGIRQRELRCLEGLI